jgi:hypothetical protein
MKMYGGEEVSGQLHISAYLPGKELTVSIG